jgi:hypothetical protein
VSVAERTTEELINILGSDCQRCHKALIRAIDNGHRDKHGHLSPARSFDFYSRQFVRAAFAYIEAVTFSVKISSAATCMDKDIDITPQERYFAADTECEINEKGVVIETTARISLARNIRFAIALNRRAHGIAESFDASVEWWSCMKSAIKLRDRLTHPKYPDDLDISGDEIVQVVKAKSGLEAEVLHFGRPPGLTASVGRAKRSVPTLEVPEGHGKT